MSPRRRPPPKSPDWITGAMRSADAGLGGTWFRCRPCGAPVSAADAIILAGVAYCPVEGHGDPMPLVHKALTASVEWNRCDPPRAPRAPKETPMPDTETTEPTRDNGRAKPTKREQVLALVWDRARTRAELAAEVWPGEPGPVRTNRLGAMLAKMRKAGEIAVVGSLVYSADRTARTLPPLEPPIRTEIEAGPPDAPAFDCGGKAAPAAEPLPPPGLGHTAIVVRVSPAMLGRLRKILDAGWSGANVGEVATNVLSWALRQYPVTE